MTEVDRLIQGLPILRDNGATGVIASHDKVLIRGAKVCIGPRDVAELSRLGFRSCPDGWYLDV